MRVRDRQPEWMDQPDLARDLHRHALVGLSRLNRFSGVASAMYRHMRKMASGRSGRQLKILDIASGSGDLPIAWAKRAAQDGLTFHITAVDISSTAIEEQQRRASAAKVSIHSVEMDCLSGSLPSGFDVATCSLFMHHLDDSHVSRLLKSMHTAADGSILICDLDRSRVNLALVAIGARLVTRSPVVHVDASLSVRAAYTAEEFKRLAESTLERPVNVRRTFPCRFMVTIDERAISESAVAFA